MAATHPLIFPPLNCNAWAGFSSDNIIASGEYFNLSFSVNLLINLVPPYLGVQPGSGAGRNNEKVSSVARFLSSLSLFLIFRYK
jgi:hypothetical protein